jgi:hypothetical protein
MPRNGIVHLTTVWNAIITMGYFPVQWKVTQIIVIPKPGKALGEARSYRPISLLPIKSKIFEKAMFKRLRRYQKKAESFQDHQFGFRQEHSTIEQVRYRDNKRSFRKKTIPLCGVPRHHTSVYGTQASCSKSEKSFPLPNTEHYNHI